MAVHTQNMSPQKIFEARRPFETTQESAIQYRLDNYRNISKSDFDLAINQTIEACNSMDVSIEIGEKTQKYLDTYRLFDGYKLVNLHDWTFNFVGRYRQTDPNSLVVVLPKHPTTNLVPRYDAELPNFNNVVNQQISTITWLVPHNDIENISDDEFRFKAGGWLLNDKNLIHPYYFRLTKEAVYIQIPSIKRSVLVYDEFVYYDLKPNKLESYTAFIVGGNSIVESDKNGEIFTYYVSDFFGASQTADILVGQLSDLQIVEARFTYPRHWIMKKECDEPSCSQDTDGIFKCDDKVCNTCHGKGFVHDTTPFGSHIMTDKDRTDNGDIKPPEGFISPDTAILQHSADRVSFYDDMKMKKLGLLSQNMTNQSGESKRYDLMQKTSLISNVVVDMFRLYENILNATASYISDNNKIEITLPKDMDVKSSDDIKIELADAKDSDLPYPAIVELTKRYMLAKFGRTQENRKKLDFLAVYDKLFVYGIEDLKSAVALFGNDITNKDKMIHLIGWQILGEIDNILELDTNQLVKVFEEKITPFIPESQTQINTTDLANSLLN